MQRRTTGFLSRGIFPLGAAALLALSIVSGWLIISVEPDVATRDAAQENASATTSATAPPPAATNTATAPPAPAAPDAAATAPPPQKGAMTQTGGAGSLSTAHATTPSALKTPPASAAKPARRSTPPAPVASGQQPGNLEDSDHLWVSQVGSYRYPRYAYAERDRLRASGFTADVLVLYDHSHNLWYCLVAGTSEDRHGATNTCTAYAEARQPPCLLRALPPGKYAARLEMAQEALRAATK